MAEGAEQHEKPVSTEQCWMCIYSTDEVAQNVTSLIVENIHNMSVEVIAKQCSLLIQQEARKQYGPDTVLEGSSTAHITKHISSHMLHANVTLALAVHSLLELNTQLRKQIYTVDENTGDSVIDVAQLKNYLLTTNQITSIYKLGDANKLLFSKMNTGDATATKDKT
eukprot:3936992-Rhodomonas_salina.1